MAMFSRNGAGKGTDNGKPWSNSCTAYLLRTDVVPAERIKDARFLMSAKRGTVPDLSFNFRLQRALRVVPVTEESQEASARHFDNEVLQIEIARAEERTSPRIHTEWPTNATDNATCVACDWRTVCPEPPGAGRHASH